MSFILLGILNSQAAGAGGAAFDLLETTYTTSATSSVSFTSLVSKYSSDYHSLQLRCSSRSSQSAAGSTDVHMEINSDTGANYSTHELYGFQSGVVADNIPNASAMYKVGRHPHTFAQTDVYGAYVIDLIDCFNTSKYKTVKSLQACRIDSSGEMVRLGSGNWRNTDAIDSLELYSSINTFRSRCRFSLYGVRS